MTNHCSPETVESGLTTFPPFQFPFYGLPYQVGALFSVLKNGVYALKSALRQSCRHLLVVDLFSAHSQNIADITYCYKSQNNRYHLFTHLRYLISSKTSERSKQMAYQTYSLLIVDENVSRWIEVFAISIEAAKADVAAAYGSSQVVQWSVK
jgi:hypothetical protein